jgi:NADH-quinone oxidoreductase subunit N
MAYISLEIAVVISGLALLMLDLWTPAEHKRGLGYAAVAALALILAFSFSAAYTGLAGSSHALTSAFASGVAFDGLSLFFKRFFLIAAILVLVLSIEHAATFETGISEYYALVLFALAGMMLAASAQDFVMLFVALELITVTFYILASFQRSRMASLEAGVKYLILGAAASAFLVYGIALVYGLTGSMEFREVARRLAAEAALAGQPLMLLGLVLILVGLGFKIAVFPFQIWTPDVYQGAPIPTTAFLAVGSKAAGFVLLLRFLYTAVPGVAESWKETLAAICAITILYGNLCAIPQRNLKRLLGYSSIAHAGYLLLGICAMAAEGRAAMLFYLAGYLVTVVGAFAVICVVAQKAEAEDIGGFAGLGQRSPLLAACLTLAMISLAGVPPTVGFLGKFLLLKAAIVNGVSFWVIAAVLVGVVISFYYYFGVIRAVYWARQPGDLPAIPLSLPMRLAVVGCVVAIVALGILPNWVLQAAEQAVQSVGY